MPSGPLKESAQALDSLLKNARYQTLLHGDAKPPNFCWNAQGLAAAVDFQYIGPGCGIRDVALFISRSLTGDKPEEAVERFLSFYFEALDQAIRQDGHKVDTGELEKEWRQLYSVAWADYARFRLGWTKSPTLSPYCQRQVVLAMDFAQERLSEVDSKKLFNVK